MKGEGGEDSVEGVRGIREGFFVVQEVAAEGEVRVEGEMRITVEELRGGVGASEVGDAGTDGGRGGSVFHVIGAVGRRAGEGAGNVAGVGTEVEDVSEGAVDVLSPLVLLVVVVG